MSDLLSTYLENLSRQTEEDPHTANSDCNNGIIDEDTVAVIPVVEDLPKYVDMCHSSDHDKMLQGVTSIRKLLSQEADPPRLEVIDTGVIGTLINFMRNTDNQPLQFQASWALSNITSAEGDCTAVVVDAGAVQVWIDHLSTSKSYQLVDQALWGVGNVMGEGAEQRDMCMQWDVLTPLLAVLNGPLVYEGPAVGRNGIWALSNLLRHESRPSWNTVIDIVDVAIKFATSKDGETSADAMWVLKYLCDFDDGPEYFFQCGILFKLLVSIDTILLRQPQSRIPLQAILAHVSGPLISASLSKYGSSSEGELGEVIGKVVELVRPSLASSERNVSAQKDALRTVFNLVKKGGSTLIQRLIDEDFVPVLMGLLADRREGQEVLKLSFSVVTEMVVRGTSSHHYTMALGNLIPLLCYPLTSCHDEEMSKAALTAIRALLKGAEGSEAMASYLSILKDIQFITAAENVASMPGYTKETRDLASRLCQTYFK